MESQEQEGDLPECPVCLEPFDSITSIPRVLQCGHSICQLCLPLLPPPLPSLPNSLRCPSCTLLVQFDRHVGPTSLPRNIDLLRLSPSSSDSRSKSNNSDDVVTKAGAFFAPLSRAQRGLLSHWKCFVLPPDSLSLSTEKEKEEEEEEEEEKEILFGEFNCDLASPWFCREKQMVSLFPLKIESFNEEKSEWFRPSYMYRVMNAIEKLGDRAREELRFLLEGSHKLRHGICKVYGLWMDLNKEESPQLFLICERFYREIGLLFKQPVDKEEMLRIGPICVELCEIMINLQLEGISYGCLGLNCFFFDEFGHVILDLNRVLVLCRRLNEINFGNKNCTDLSKIEALLSPEILTILHKGRDIKYTESEQSIGYYSDVWCLACLISMILIGDRQLVLELMEAPVQGEADEKFVEFYENWKRNKVMDKLKSLLTSTKLEFLIETIDLCLSYELKKRPGVVDLYSTFRRLFVKDSVADVASYDSLRARESVGCCLILSNFYSSCVKKGDCSNSRVENSKIERGNLVKEIDEPEIDKPSPSDGFSSVTLMGHRDCITSLAIGGGFLFSSSYDKTINVWSLQDFSLVQTLRGHEHRVMAVLVTEYSDQTVCVSGDNGSGICIWKIHNSSFIESEPFKKWYEHSDWRFSGVHSLTVSNITSFLYTGGGDKSIKAWSLQDYSLLYTMVGHRSTVSSLLVQDGILYSGSWDGTVRMWWLTDHSPLSVLGEKNDLTGNLVPVLSICASTNLVVSSYENGYIKIWMDGTLVKSEKIKTGAIYATQLDKNCLFTGGWDKIVNIQDLAEDESGVETREIASITCNSVITTMLTWQGKLFVGFSNKEIKVYSKGS